MDRADPLNVTEVISGISALFGIWCVYGVVFDAALFPLWVFAPALVIAAVGLVANRLIRDSFRR